MREKETYPSRKECSFEFLTPAQAEKIKGDYYVGTELDPFSDPREVKAGISWYNPEIGIVYKLQAFTPENAEKLVSIANPYALHFMLIKKGNNQIAYTWVADFDAPRYVVDTDEWAIVGEVKNETPTMERWYQLFSVMSDIEN